ARALALPPLSDVWQLPGRSSAVIPSMSCSVSSCMRVPMSSSSSFPKARRTLGNILPSSSSEARSRSPPSRCRRRGAPRTTPSRAARLSDARRGRLEDALQVVGEDRERADLLLDVGATVALVGELDVLEVFAFSLAEREQ